MRYLLLAPILAVMLLMAGCPSVEVLEPAHDMAVENQQNLDANVETLITQFLDVARSHQDYEESDEEVLEALTSVIREQMDISTAYMALIDAFIKGKDLDADAFGRFLADLPGMIEEGVDIWEEFERLFGDSE